MEITIAKNSGFCFGVKRAVGMVEKLWRRRKPIYTNGPIIHNPQAIKSLSRKGVKTLGSSEEAMCLKNGLLVIRTHGMEKDFPEKISPGVTLVDATCPFVKRAQGIVKKLSADGRHVIILGDDKHPEVKGLVSYADRFTVIKNPRQAARLKVSGKVGFLSQTTQSVKHFTAIASAIRKKNAGALIYDTICRTTASRQREVEKIARKSDIMIVVGGKNSANTTKLADISRKYAPTRHIETPRELKKSWFRKVSKTGIAAGASTPDFMTMLVAQRVRELAGGK